MASKTSHRQRAQRQQRLLAATVRRAERRGNSFDAAWARAQYEMRTGETYPAVHNVNADPSPLCERFTRSHYPTGGAA